MLKPASLDAFFAHGDGENLIVIHCAGVVSIASRFIQKVYDVNFKGTQNIVEMCETYGAKKLVYVSSVHAIPELPAGQVMTEIDDFHPRTWWGSTRKPSPPLRPAYWKRPSGD